MATLAEMHHDVSTQATGFAKAAEESRWEFICQAGAHYILRHYSPKTQLELTALLNEQLWSHEAAKRIAELVLAQHPLPIV